VDIAVVDGIVKMQQITAVPHAPSFVEGITNLRGEVMPVIDLRKRFGLPQADATKDTRIVNVEMDGAQGVETARMRRAASSSCSAWPRYSPPRSKRIYK